MKGMPALFAAGLLVALGVGTVAAEPFSQGRLWRIARPGVPDSFVFGTIHVSDPRVSAIPPPVAAALARSRTLATELTVDTAMASRGSDLEEAAEGQLLEPLIGAADFELLRRQLREQEIPERKIERMKPWAALLKSTRTNERNQGTSLDAQLFSMARDRRMQVAALEFFDEQVAAFDAVPMETQVALLKQALAHRDLLARASESTIAAWLRGDLAALADMCEGICASSPEMRQHYAQLRRHIVVDRTALLHHRLFMPLRKGRVFVAVGAMHLQGEQGLLAMLQEDGYRVTRLW